MEEEKKKRVRKIILIGIEEKKREKNIFILLQKINIPTCMLLTKNNW